MKFIRTFLLILSCLGLFAANVANAYTQCCCMKKSESIQDSTDKGIDMPCHKTAKNDTKKPKQCDGCGCKHCVKISSILPSRTSIAKVSVIETSVLSDSKIESCKPESLLQPPKIIS